jgi:hypothetical protein
MLIYVNGWLTYMRIYESGIYGSGQLSYMRMYGQVLYMCIAHKLNLTIWKLTNSVYVHI